MEDTRRERERKTHLLAVRPLDDELVLEHDEVALARGVAHQLQRLQVVAGHVEALEAQRALLDAARHGVAWHVGRLRRPRLPPALGASLVGHC